MALSDEVAVFIDTNMDTHIAMAISPDITAVDFKRELERVHFSCFPNLGEIEVYKLTVKRKSCFYHLPESLPVKYAFQGLKGTWFLQVETRSLNGLNKLDLSQCIGKNDDYLSDGSNVADSVITKTETVNMSFSGGEKKMAASFSFKPLMEELPKSACHSKKNRKKKKQCPNGNEQNPGVVAKDDLQIHKNKFKPVNRSSKPMEKTSNEMSTQVIPAAGNNKIDGKSSSSTFVSKHCGPQIVEVTSTVIRSCQERQLRGERNDNCSSMQGCTLPQFAVRTPPKTSTLLTSDPRPRSTGNKFGSPLAVGKRVMIAAKNLRISRNKQRPAITFNKFKSTPGISSKVIKVFEISDNDD